jgi:transposase
MPARKEFTPEFKDQAVKFLFEEIAVDESRYAACERLGPRLNVKPATLYGWVKAAAPAGARRAGQPVTPGSIEDLRFQLAAVRKENRELVRANEILLAASAFFGSTIDRQTKR